MAFRIGPSFDASQFTRGVGIQRRPPSRHLFPDSMAPAKRTFIRHDRRFRSESERPWWLRHEDATARPSGGRVGGAYPGGSRTEGARPSRKRTRDDSDDDDDDDSDDSDSIHTRPRKRPRDKEWGLIKYCGLLFCCIDFLLSFKPEALEANERVRNQQIVKEEIERIFETQEQLKEHPEYYVVRGQKVYLADVGYGVRFPHQHSESTTTPPDTDDQGTQTRPPGASGLGTYQPGAPLPPSDDGGGGASKSHVAPTHTTHNITLPGSKPHITGPSIRQRSMDEEGYESRLPRRDNRSRLVDGHGRLVDEKGRRVDEKGRPVNNRGQLVNDKGQLVDEHGRIPYHLLDDGYDPWPESYVPPSGTRPARPPRVPPQPYIRPVRPVRYPPQPSVQDETEEEPYVPVRTPPKTRPARPKQAPPQPSVADEAEEESYTPTSPPGTRPVRPNQAPPNRPVRPAKYQQQPPNRPVRPAKHPPQPSVEDEVGEQHHTPTGRPPGTRPANPGAGEVSEVTGAHETLPNWPQQKPLSAASKATQTQQEPPTDESSLPLGDTQSKANSVPSTIENMTGAWTAIASSLPGSSEKTVTYPELVDSTVDPTRFPDNMTIPATKGKKPGRIPAAFQSDEDAEKEKKLDPIEKLHAQDSQYRPFPRDYKIIGTPRGPYGVRRAPDMVIDKPTYLDIDELLGQKTMLGRTTFDKPKKCGVGNPNCQQYEAATFTDGRSLRAHEITHNFMMFGGVGPAGSCDEDGNAYALTPEEKEKLLRERQKSRRSIFVDREYQRALWDSAQEARNRKEMEKAEEPLTQEDLQEQMTAEEFAKMLEEETIGDEAGAQQFELSQQQQQELYEQQQQELFQQQQQELFQQQRRELYAQQLEELDQERLRKEFYTIYDDDELEAMMEEDELRELGLL